MTKKYDQPDAMIFDMDGTLFRTETILIDAYYRMFDSLRDEKLYEGETPPVENILNSLGMLLAAIWKRVMPDASEETHRRADDLLLEYEIDELKNGKPELYEGVEETLRILKERGIRLFVASNGLEPYVKDVAYYTGIKPLFEDLYSAGEYKTASKVELVRLLLEKHQIRSAWMVGDRSSDMEAALGNNLIAVGCDYAKFRSSGELKDADLRITSFSDILNHLV
ncbi:HAD family hydrolase [Paenibacillus albiflavus]|uniref:HAD family hydrolase n=2 Tax=Paenibacillus albiflavus TaxID=2545760 RepID=A0A4R4EBR9_9BACL|nr:HAD hydrolase-like protein [Paenibacillus albiflavus]TCZ75355.1 HAD family hydrolase [Paenibacillus albiflavus]